MIEREENEEDRRAALTEFYRIYREAQKKHSLRMHSHFSIFEKEGLIEIWEYHGEAKGRRICYVKEESETGCYRRAAEDVKNYADGKKAIKNAQGT